MKMRSACLSLSLAFALASTAEAQTATPKAKRTRHPAVPSGFPVISPAKLASDLAELQSQRERYTGIKVSPHPQATGQTLAFHRSLASMLVKADFVPDERINHFKWIAQEHGAVITGWDATIISAVALADSTIVKIKVTARHDGDVGFHAPGAYVIESYEMSGFGSRYLGSEVPASRGIIIFN